MTCQVCGRSPATKVTFRRIVGMLILARTVWIKPVVCKEHGEAVGKAFLKRTLVQGWWSILSLFILNPVAIVLDLLALRKVRSLGDPQGEARTSEGAAELQQAIEAAAGSAPPRPDR